LQSDYGNAVDDLIERYACPPKSLGQACQKKRIKAIDIERDAASSDTHGRHKKTVDAHAMTFMRS